MNSRQYIPYALLLLLSAPVGAEIYRWTDSDGSVHFSDEKPANPNQAVEQVQLGPVNTYAAPPQVYSNNTPKPASRQPAASNDVVIYTTQRCSVCQQAKQYMNAKGVDYVERDVETSAEARRQFAAYGGKGVPLILVGNERMLGFSPEHFDHLLRQAGHPLPTR
jgi:glutaredoxin